MFHFLVESLKGQCLTLCSFLDAAIIEVSIKMEAHKTEASRIAEHYLAFLKYNRV